jgi:hypothetical protein
MPLDARHVVDRLSTCPHVTGVHAGPLGTIVTPTDAGPVVGIRIIDSMIVIGIVVGPGADDADVAAGVRARVSDVAPGLPVSLSFRKLPAA